MCVEFGLNFCCFEFISDKVVAVGNPLSDSLVGDISIVVQFYFVSNNKWIKVLEIIPLKACQMHHVCAIVHGSK